MVRPLLCIASIVALTTSAVAQSPAPAKAAPVESQGYTYRPEGRRDPFVSLLRRGSDSQRTATEGPRTGGLAGLSTDEITLKGTLASQGGFVALVQGADNKTYIVHTGDKLLDGAVRTISADAMVILQQVDDPISKQKVREVRKALRQTEEAK
jgi:Tfp pilus assembly protein PilP